jgi:hypothetical protein
VRRFIEESVQGACSSLCLRLADSGSRTKPCRIDALLLFQVSAAFFLLPV